MNFTAHKDMAIDYDGTQIKAFDSVFDSPFVPWCSAGLSNYCYVIYRGILGKYKIRESIVHGIWFTNIWGWCLDNGWKYKQDDLGKTIFIHNDEELKKAISICERENRMRKVKVKYI